MYVHSADSHNSVVATEESFGTDKRAAVSVVRIFLLLENRLLREALARIFRKRDNLRVVGTIARENCSPQKVLESQCHVVILDFLDPALLRLLRDADNANVPLPGFLLVGMNGQCEQFLAAVRAGATGYLLKDASTQEIMTAVSLTSQGAAICPPALCGCLFRYVSSTANGHSVRDDTVRPLLTLRQQRLAALIARGWTNKEIASHLHLSEHTVRNHVYRMMKQVDASNRSDAVERILSHGYALAAQDLPGNLRRSLSG